MGESAQAVLALMVIIGVIGSVMAWMTDGAILTVRLGFPTMTLLAFGVLLWSILRKDKLPDHLSGITRRFFERDGFCFTVVPHVIEGFFSPVRGDSM